MQCRMIFHTNFSPGWPTRSWGALQLCRGVRQTDMLMPDCQVRDSTAWRLYFSTYMRSRSHTVKLEPYAMSSTPLTMFSNVAIRTVCMHVELGNTHGHKKCHDALAVMYCQMPKCTSSHSAERYSATCVLLLSDGIGHSRDWLWSWLLPPSSPYGKKWGMLIIIRWRNALCSGIPNSFDRERRGTEVESIYAPFSPIKTIVIC